MALPPVPEADRFWEFPETGGVSGGVQKAQAFWNDVQGAEALWNNGGPKAPWNNRVATDGVPGQVVDVRGLRV